MVGVRACQRGGLGRRNGGGYEGGENSKGDPGYRSDGDSAACLWQWGGKRVGSAQVQGWTTAVLAPALVTLHWHPALLSRGHLVRGQLPRTLKPWSYSRTSSLTRSCRLCFARSRTCSRQTGSSPFLCTPASCIPLFLAIQQVHQSSGTSGVREWLGVLCTCVMLLYSSGTQIVSHMGKRTSADVGKYLRKSSLRR
jgi:hypothetical protein